MERWNVWDKMAPLCLARRLSFLVLWLFLNIVLVLAWDDAEQFFMTANRLWRSEMLCWVEITLDRVSPVWIFHRFHRFSGTFLITCSADLALLFGGNAVDAVASGAGLPLDWRLKLAIAAVDRCGTSRRSPIDRFVLSFVRMPTGMYSTLFPGLDQMELIL